MRGLNMTKNIYFDSIAEFEEYAIDEEIPKELQKSFNRYLNGAGVMQDALATLINAGYQVWVAGSRWSV